MECLPHLRHPKIPNLVSIPVHHVPSGARIRFDAALCLSNATSRQNIGRRKSLEDVLVAHRDGIKVECGICRCYMDQQGMIESRKKKDARKCPRCSLGWHKGGMWDLQVLYGSARDDRKSMTALLALPSDLFNSLPKMDNEVAITRSFEGGSNRITALNVQGPTPPNSTGQPSDDKDFDDQNKPGWRKFMSFVGPGFLVSMAYIDPGSMETDLQAGANYGYELLWVIFIGFIFVLIIQSLAANLGVTTGKHLAELCKAEYPPIMKYCLWLLAEFAVINADIPEVIGTAFALNILAHIPVWVGVLLTGLSTLLLLGLQRYGIRKLELLITVLVFVLAACFFGEMGYVKPPASQVLKGLFVPKLSGSGAVGDSIAVLGALIMPHNLFLHSALVLSRKVPRSVRGINEACKFFLQESAFALFVALLINIAMISVSGAVCSAPDITSDTAKICNNLTLDSASFLLKNVLGRSSSMIYAIALLASGQSSSITGTYAGQFIMQGFINLKIKGWKRNLVTRSIAIVPSLIVSIIGGPNGAGRLIIISSMILLFELPFALLPLLKFSSSSIKMGPHKNSIYIIVFSWIGSFGIMGINIYYLSTGFVDWLFHNSLPKVANIFMGILVFPLMAVYMVAMAYLTLRKDRVVTFNGHQSNQVNMESGVVMTSNPLDEVPYREDLADIPIPE